MKKEKDKIKSDLFEVVLEMVSLIDDIDKNKVLLDKSLNNLSNRPINNVDKTNKR